MDLYEKIRDQETVKTFFGTLIEPDQPDFDFRNFRPVQGKTPEEAAIAYLMKLPLLFKRENRVSVAIAHERKFPTIVHKIDLEWGQSHQEE